MCHYQVNYDQFRALQFQIEMKTLVSSGYIELWIDHSWFNSLLNLQMDLKQSTLFIEISVESCINPRFVKDSTINVVVIY